MKHYVLSFLRRIWRPVLFLLLGVFLTLLIGFVWVVNHQADLEVWHTAELDAEFTVDSEVDTFEEYLALEDRLFSQLDELVYDRVPASRQSDFNRYTRGSRADPARWDRNWNRTFELEHPSPRAGFLLLHGMSDSPYSLRNLAERLHAVGAWTVGMRMPGHGAAPSGLTTATWEDMAAAVRIGVRHVRSRIGDRPLFLVGYSNGGALSVHYALDALEDADLPRVDGMVLMSPMIGVTPAAALAIWQERIGGLLGLDKLRWNSVTPEYDPFKYGSFAVNAGDQTYRLTSELARRFDALRGGEALKRFPRVLAFQSAADATVSASDLISVLMSRLPEGGHELVLFDINRTTQAANLLKRDPGPELTRLLKVGTRSFGLSVVTNRSETDPAVVEWHIRPGQSEAEQTDLGLEWPRELFSLAHIALPFPASDPLYGDGSGKPSPGVRLGDFAMRGERGVLSVAPGDMLRIRWNPFFSYLESRTFEFVGFGPG